MPDWTILARPTEENDAKKISEMRNDPSTFMVLHNAEQFAEHDVKKWIKSLSTDSKRFTILCTEYQGFIGLFRIDNIDWKNRNCMVGLDIHPDVRGKGFGKASWRYMLEFLFNQWNMHMVYLEVLRTNQIAKDLYSKLGFWITGHKPEAIFRNDEYQDSVIMSLTKFEWEKYKDD